MGVRPGYDKRQRGPANHDERFEEVARLGGVLMAKVGEVVPALPVALVATALLEAGDVPLAALELKARVVDVIRRLEARGAHVHVPRADQDYAVEVGLRMLRLRRLIYECGSIRRTPCCSATTPIRSRIC